MKLSDEAIQRLDKLPAHCRDSMRAYFEEHQPIGDFLRAVLENDLVFAAMRADNFNRVKLHEYANWLHWYAPSCAYGSPEAVEAWLNMEDKQ